MDDNSSDIINDNPYDFVLCSFLTPTRVPRPNNQRLYKYVLNELNEMGETWLVAALKYGYDDATIAAFLELETDVNNSGIDGRTPLHIAASRMTGIITELLIGLDVNINVVDQIGDTPLHIAVKHSSLVNVRKLLDQPNIAYDAKNRSDLTPLYLAISAFYTGLDNGMNDNYPIITALLNRGCDINLSNHNIRKHTVLHHALQQKEMNLVQMLIQRGADLHAEDALGMTPLHYAICYNTDEVVYMLLYYGASGNHKDLEGRTPLELALKKGKREIAAYLMLYTDDFDERNSTGMTLLQTAMRYHSKLALEMLKNGADVNLAFNQHDCLTIALLNDDTSEMFETIWPRIDVPSHLLNRYDESNYHRFGSMLEMLTSWCEFPGNQLLKCFYMIFESQDIDLIIIDHINHGSRSLLFKVISKVCSYDLPLEDRLRISYLFLYHNIEIYYEDVQCIFEIYGFDKQVELLLKQGIRYPRVNPNFDLNPPRVGPDFHLNPLFCMIWYNYFPTSEILKEIPRELQLQYRRYFRANFDIDFNHEKSNKRPYVVTEVPSLLQLSRDAVRDAMYKRWSTEGHFKVFQMFSALPIPPVLREALYLRKPLYTV